MISQPLVVQELRKIAEKYKLPYKVVEEIVDNYFIQVASVMAEADRDNNKFPTISIPNFGKFIVKKGRVNYYNYINNEAKQKSIESEEVEDTQED